MTVKSVAITDYSTGTQYSYSGTSGTWQSIQSQGGKINSGGGKAVAAADSGSISSTSDAAPLPFSGTHRKEEDAVTTRANVYPWVATTMATSTTAPTSYPNLPSGYKVGANGRIYRAAAPQSCWCHLLLRRFFGIKELTHNFCRPTKSRRLPHRRRLPRELHQRMVALKQ